MLLRNLILALIGLFFHSCTPSESLQTLDYSGWATFGGTKDAARYSSLDQINKENVKDLQVAWTFNTGDATERSQIQCQPIVVDGVLFATSPQVNVFALDATTGKLRWRFNPFHLLGGQNSWAGTNRGVTYWEEGEDKRILFTAGNWLMALDAKDGRPIESFGEGGKVDLQMDLDTDLEEFLIVSNTPGIIYKDKLIIGMRLSEGLDAAPGHVRAYDVKTGKRE